MMNERNEIFSWCKFQNKEEIKGFNLLYSFKKNIDIWYPKSWQELVPGSFIFVPGFWDKKYQSKTKRGQMPKWNKQQNIIHRLTNNTVTRLAGK
jgi:hypothetical protein